LELILPKSFAEQIDCSLINQYQGRAVIDFDLTARAIDLPILGHSTSVPKTFSALTFNEQIPGPTLRVTEGDVVKMTLIVLSAEPTAFGINMYPSEISSENLGRVNPGTTTTQCFIARVPGIFSYHGMGISNVGRDQHTLSGMYGMIIVDPLDGYRKLLVRDSSIQNENVIKSREFLSEDALEFQIQYGQLFLTDQGYYDASKMFKKEPTFTAVNGIPFGYMMPTSENVFPASENVFPANPWKGNVEPQYKSRPLVVPIGEHIRFFVENHGNEPVFFHIDGVILERVVQGNRVQVQGIETFDIAGSQGAIIDVVFEKPGQYLMINNDYSAMFTGAASVIFAQDSGIPAENPSDAIPPLGINSIPHSIQHVHGLYSDKRAEEVENAPFPFYNYRGNLQPDPKLIVFEKKTDASDPNSKIFTIKDDGSDLQQLTSGFEPRFSPDGTKILFRAPLNHNIGIMDYDGSNLIEIGENFCACFYPDLSPDGSKILFSKQILLKKHIFITDTIGSYVQELTSGFLDTKPRWSPDGDAIVFYRDFVSEGRIDYEIWMMDYDENNIASAPRFLTDGNHPEFSPSGNTIIFTSRGELFRINYNSGEVFQIPFEHYSLGIIRYPSESGTRIAFIANLDGNYIDIHTITQNGYNLKQLTSSSDWEVTLNYQK